VEEESRAAGAHPQPQNRGRRERKDNTRGDKDWIGVLWPLGLRHENGQILQQREKERKKNGESS